MIALVGLGNPGEKYDLNRHNIGHMVLNTIISCQKEVITEKKLGGQIANFKYGSKNIKTFKSSDFMNECGISINKFILKSTQKFKYDKLNGKMVKIPYFDIDNEMVWGATSIILSEFKNIILEIL